MVYRDVILEVRGILMLFLWCGSASICASNGIGKDSLYANYSVNQVQLVLSMGSSFFSQPTAFFEEYQNSIGGIAKEFRTHLQFGVALKYQFDERYRLSISTSYNFARFQDQFKQYYETATISGFRYVSESFDVVSVPVIPTLECLPNNEQFRSVIGFGVGVVYSYIYWYEGVSSEIPNDLRRSGIRYEEKALYPAMSLYSGVELRFDKEHLENFVESVLIEGKISYFARKIKIFENFKSQFLLPADNWNRSFPIIDNMFTLSVGLALNTTKFFLNKHN